MNIPECNADRFLTAHARLEGYLRRITDEDVAVGFSQLVRIASKSHPAVSRNREDLLQFARLRNAIVHERTGDQVIAQPSDWAVNKIELIAGQLLDPPRVIPLFKKAVLTLSIGDSLARAVKAMLDRDFSQIPVYDGPEFVGLLTANTIARWLGAHVEDEIVSLEDSTIADVLKYTEDHDNNVFLSKGATVFEVVDRFRDYERRGKKLEAILITERGKPTETLLGIVTIWDLPKIDETLEPP